ncbi:MAG: alpha/beta hydrolase [Bacteroidales bacterium]|nr:alpha/beta hydrolase [Bacteroidales bacterium]
MKKIFLISVLAVLWNCSFSLNPSRTYYITPADYGMNFEEVNIQTEDNLLLFGWLYKANEASSGKIIILSDDGNGNMADLIELASNFISLGYNVLTYDYRGYGKSSDFNINKTFYIYAQFQKDIDAALNHVKKYYSRFRSVHLYGTGIGAGLSLCAGAYHPEVSKIIADSPYLDFESIQKIIKEKTGAELKLPLGYNRTLLEPKYAFDAKGAGITGILIIAGEKEEIYNPTYVREVAKLKSGVTTTYIVKGATCENTFSINKTKYFEEIKAFFK